MVALSRGGKGTHAGGDQILRGDLRQAATRLVLPLWPFGQHARAANRGGWLVYDSDAYNDDLPYYVEVTGTQHLIVPYSLTYNDARFVLPQGYGSPSDFHDLLKRGFDYLWDEGKTHPRMMNIGLHPRLIGQAGRISGLAEFIDYAQNKGRVWFATRLEIANWWNDHHEEFKR